MAACRRPSQQVALSGLTPFPAAAVQEPVRKLQNQWQVLWKQEEEREASLQELLALAGRFWPGLADLAVALSNAQQMVLDLEGAAASDPKDIRAKLVAMQVQAGAQEPLWHLPEEAGPHCPSLQRPREAPTWGKAMLGEMGGCLFFQ